MSEHVLAAHAEPRATNLLHSLIETRNDYSPVILRIGLGLVIFPHGAQKLLGWFGGYGFSGTMNFFTETMGIPYLFALLAILAESLGAIALMTGLFTRISALSIGLTIGVAALMAHLEHGFFMNWYGNQAGEGIEYHLLVVAMAAALLLKGGGRWSLDRLMAQKMGPSTRNQH